MSRAASCGPAAGGRTAAPSPDRRRDLRARRLQLFLSLAALSGGIGLTGWALWVPAKATLGHYLIASAYDRSKAAREGGQVAAIGERARPWAWADVRPLARLRFPSLGGAERYILDQASGEAMAWGAGWIRGSAPLGEPGLSAAAAHRDTHFALLQHVSPGDILELETLDGVSARYQVLRGEVVDSRVWRLPAIGSGPDLLALSTCWPFGAETIGPMRYVLFAARIETTGG